MPHNNNEWFHLNTLFREEGVPERIWIRYWRQGAHLGASLELVLVGRSAPSRWAVFALAIGEPGGRCSEVSLGIGMPSVDYVLVAPLARTCRGDMATADSLASLSLSDYARWDVAFDYESSGSPPAVPWSVGEKPPGNFFSK